MHADTKEEDIIQPHITEEAYSASAQSVVLDEDYPPISKSLRQRAVEMRAEVVQQYNTMPYNDRYTMHKNL